jgi:hypothetical protein
VAVGLAVVLVGVGVFVAIAGLADRTRRRLRVTLAGLTVLVPLGLGVGLGWSEFSNRVVQDSGEGVSPGVAKPETIVYSCPPPFDDNPRVYVGFGFREPPCAEDAQLRRRIAAYLFVGAGVSIVALLLSGSLKRRCVGAVQVAPLLPLGVREAYPRRRG